MNRYFLTINDVRCSDEIEIDEKDYKDAIVAVSRARLGALVEEKLDLLLENYIDLERELLELGLQSSIRSSYANQIIEESRPRLDRRIVNLLSSARIYVDQVCHELSTEFGNSSETYNAFNQKRRTIHSENLSYQFMEQLRNHVQHYSLPIDVVSFRSQLNLDEDPPAYVYGVIPRIRVTDLREVSTFKADVLDRMDALSDKNGLVDLGTMISQYVDCFLVLHAELRELLSSLMSDAEMVYDKLRGLAASRYSESKLIGLIAVEVDERDNVLSQCYLRARRLERWRTLSRRNLTSGNLSKSYVRSRNI